MGVLQLENSNAPAVSSVLKKLGFSPLLTNKPEELSELSHLIVPGVGSFAAVVEEVKEKHKLGDSLLAFTQSEKPVLGICLGMQLFGTSSEESPGVPGLGLLDFKVEAINSLNGQFPIPHVGWNQIEIKSQCPLFDGIPSGTDFYFSHSFQVTDSNYEVTQTGYSEKFISSVQKGNIFGVQFHPERSQEFGHRILENFIRL